MNGANSKGLSSKEQLFLHSLGHSLAVLIGFSLFYIIFFSSVLFADKLLAPGDGPLYFLPAFYYAKTLWTDLIFSGYPIAADPQNMTWYPPALIMSFIPNSWNSFILLAYILAGSFAYSYTYFLTKSRLAATATGITYSLSGFMIAHLGHAGMIHAAAWIPLIVLSLEKLRHQINLKWWVVGSFAVACCFLGGHPQISVYGVGTGFFYAVFLGWSASIGRWKYYQLAASLIAMGTALCAIQILPAIELTRASLRSEITLEAFLQFSLPTWQTLQLIFPYFFGGVIPPYSLYPQWGAWGLTETTGYVGLLPILLAIIGAIAYYNRSVSRFWFWFSLATLLVAFGSDLFIGQALYYVPVYNKFRAQGRHFVEFSLAISVLAGLGIASIQQHMAPKRLNFKVITASLIVMLNSLISMKLLYSFFIDKAGLAGIEHLSFLPWKNPAVGIPIVVFGVSVVSLVALTQFSNARWSSFFLIAVLIIDLSSFSWFYEWRVNAPSTNKLNSNETVNKYRDLLQANNQRILTSEGIFSSDPSGLAPNATLLWDLPNASGYSPLTMTRISQMMHMDQGGVSSHIPTLSSEHQFDLMSVRYLLAALPNVIEQQGVDWDIGTDLEILLGSGGCASPDHNTTAQIDLSGAPYQATSIGLVTNMGCSTEIPNNTEVIGVRVTGTDGKIESYSLQAGQDTSEYIYDCQTLGFQIQHQRAQIFSSVTTPGVSNNCQVNNYVSIIQLNHPQQISNIELNWRSLSGIAHIKHISVINSIKNTSLPVTPIEFSTKWRKFEQLKSDIIYENQDVMPRAWLVPKTLALQPQEVLAAVHTSRLPDGQVFDPKITALVEDSAATLQSSELKSTDYANVLNIAETQVEIETQTIAPAFLVLSDVFYPGWKATVDGQWTRIFQTNYIQRGVKLPPGKHIVRFEFDPLSFRLGFGITVASCFACLYILLRTKNTLERI